MNESHTIPRAIEVGFPIVEINRLAVPERNAFKPIYQMHKWFARRASCVFRAILLGSLKPAFQPDGTPTDLMAEFYKDHTDDPDTKGKHILDPFMGGGTTVVEALRLGCNVTGIDINPVAWFIVKTEVEPVDLDELQQAFARLAARPVEWNDNRPLRETLLNLYKTEVEQGLEADVIYTFWVKHAICTDPNCRREVPLFKDYIIAQKSPSVRYFRDVMCPHCGQMYDWDIENVSLIVDPAMMVNAPRGSSGTGRPVSKWSYAPWNPKQHSIPMLDCPHCHKKGIPKLKGQKIERKKVPYTVLLCPACEAVWQWRGNVPEGAMECPACGNAYDPYKGNVPQKGKFLCPYCGNRDKIIESIRRLPQDRRLPIRPYALQAYLPAETFYDDDVNQKQDKLFQMNYDQGQTRPSNTPPLEKDKQQEFIQRLPKNGKFFLRFSVSDKAQLQQAERLWKEHKYRLPYPNSKIPVGEKTKSGLLAHHYNHWHEMFGPRQLLALSTLLKGIMEENDETIQEMLLSAFYGALESNNLFCRYTIGGGNKSQGIFSRHDFQPKLTLTENNPWGSQYGHATFRNEFDLVIEAKTYCNKPYDRKIKPKNSGKVIYESFYPGDFIHDDNNSTHLFSLSSSGPSILKENYSFVVTDPPYVGNVNYAELSDFFYVWLRLALKDRYPHFAPEYTPKVDEIIENRTRGKSIQDFYRDLAKVFSQIHDVFPDEGLLVFTFHHTDQRGTVWEGLLQALCETGFEIVAVYPIHGESESSLHLMDKENVSYDLIHVCRKRRSDAHQRSWAGIRQEVRQRARAELTAIQEGRYGKEPLLPPDVRLICIGKCLQLYSAHYGQVVDHKGNPLPLRFALQDIGTIVDQLVTKDRPLPSELEEVDPISYAWLRVLLKIRREVKVDEVNKALRAMQITPDELKKSGLIIHGRTGRGRTYEVKQPNERLNTLLEKLKSPEIPGSIQTSLFDEVGDPIIRDVGLVDLVHLLIGLADAGESVAPWLERFSGQQPKVRAALRFIREERPDWEGPISRILPLVDETSFFKHVEAN
jgi:putative DNA methylase